MDNDYRTIPLTQGQSAIVDATDFELLSKFKWFAQWDPHTRTFRASRTVRINGNRTVLLMHRAIMGNPKGAMVDHRDGDTLNNRRYNLRNADHSQNGCNRRVHRNSRSGIAGVRWRPDLGKWTARIQIRRKNYSLGAFATAEEAAAVRAAAAKEMHGEFAMMIARKVKP